MKKNSTVRAKINHPSKDPSEPGYEDECEFALEPSVSMLVDEAVAAGWQLRYVVCAVILVAAQRFSEAEEKDGLEHLHS